MALPTVRARRIAWAATLLLCALAARGWAQQPATTRAAALPITITGVEGMVQVRDSSDKPWRKAVVGATVTEGAEFRTGPRSAVRILIPPDQTITLDRLGVIKLMQVLQDGKTVKTKVGMPFGRTRYDIEAAGLEHKSELVSPSSTLAIRGTKVSIYDQPPFAPSAVSLTGRAEYRTAKRQVAFGGKNAGRTDVSSTSDSPAELSLLRSFVDPVSTFGRPESDRRLLNQLQAKGDILLRGGELALATGGPVTDPQLASFIAGQGRFNIALRWDGPVDMDLFVLTPDAKTGLPAYTLGNPSYAGSIFKDIGLFQGVNTTVPPVTAARTGDGGRIKFDQIALGGGGLELASWTNPPRVPYTIAVALNNHLTENPKYPTESAFRLEAFLDGKRVPVMLNYEAVRDVGQKPDFGPVLERNLQLVGGGRVIWVNPPANFDGVFGLSVVDLSPVGTTSRAARPTTASPRPVMGPIVPVVRRR